MRALYNILFTVFFILATPYYFYRMARRGNWRNGFWQRFGIYGPSLKHAVTNRHVLWVHAVSVGEVLLLIQFIRALEARAPNLKFVVSTTTTTGMGILRQRLPTHISKIYYPIDQAGIVARALSTIHPDAIVLFETEIWPNFIWKAQKRGIPLFLANARLSRRSFRGYRRFGFLFRQLFETFEGIAAKSEAEAERFRGVGCRPDRVRVTGNLKYDTATATEPNGLDVPGLLKQIGANGDTPILIGGSTHDGEEVVLADIAQRLRTQFPKLFLILVPRHFERSPEIARKLRERGVKLLFRTAVQPDTRLVDGEINCLLVDTTGELRSFYEYATVVFIGKSLTAEGGQNPIEPAAAGKAIVFGPHMQNFADIAPEFVEKNGAVQVRDAAMLEKVLGELLEDKYQRAELGRNALLVVSQNQGAMERTLAMVLDKLKSIEVYVVPHPGTGAR
ncbi:MAG TPA: 3-deoxy-D-manno-octulosonic acid transferase [Candidatus Sulfotelmatobacter sp.]|nr:3-deoxy-D-manno-octulosonic acid transferase [Candidatus Sulfotelmatobacter sp.]